MKKIITFLIAISIFIPTTIFAYTANQDTGGAQVNNPTTSSSQNQTLPKIDNPLNASSIQDIIFLAVDIAIYVGTAFAILAIIFVGFKFVAAQGSDEKLKDAKKWFFYIIIGFAILISSKVIVEIVKNTLIQSGVVNQDVWNPSSRNTQQNYDYTPNQVDIPTNQQNIPNTLPNVEPSGLVPS